MHGVEEGSEEVYLPDSKKVPLAGTRLAGIPRGVGDYGFVEAEGEGFVWSLLG